MCVGSFPDNAAPTPPRHSPLPSVKVRCSNDWMCADCSHRKATQSVHLLGCVGDSPSNLCFHSTFQTAPWTLCRSRTLGDSHLLQIKETNTVNQRLLLLAPQLICNICHFLSEPFQGVINVHRRWHTINLHGFTYFVYAYMIITMPLAWCWF